MTIKLIVAVKGGAGSGNWGHTGRPGLVGGSGGRGVGLAGGSAPTESSLSDEDQYEGLHSLVDAMYAADESLREKADRVAGESGVDVDDVMYTFKSWNYPADPMRGLKDPDDQSIRTAAADEFGLPVTASGSDLMQKDVMGFELPVTDARYREGTVSSAHQRAILRGVYNLTQQSLEKSGYAPGDTITLYKGIRTPSGVEVGSSHAYRGQTLDSWAYDLGSAKEFGNAVVAMNVPVRNILDYGNNGFGVGGESEVVVLGSLDGDVRVVQFGR